MVLCGRCQTRCLGFCDCDSSDSSVTPAGDKGVENVVVIRAEHARVVQRVIGAEGWHVEDGPIKGR